MARPENMPLRKAAISRSAALAVGRLARQPRQSAATVARIETLTERAYRAIEERIVTLERAIREAHPDVFAVFIKPQTAGVYQSSRRRFLQQSS